MRSARLYWGNFFFSFLPFMASHLAQFIRLLVAVPEDSTNTQQHTLRNSKNNKGHGGSKKWRHVKKEVRDENQKWWRREDCAENVSSTFFVTCVCVALSVICVEKTCKWQTCHNFSIIPSATFLSAILLLELLKLVTLVNFQRLFCTFG